jgi:hypothetical protein
MAKLGFNFGDRWKNLNQLPTVEHNLYFQYLIVSPSYWKAHLIRKGDLSIGDKELPKDIKAVLKTYDIFGDIFTKPFEIWWEQTGCDLFYSEADATTLNIAVDITKSKKILMEQIALRISEAQERQKKSKKPKAFLEVNKIQPFSLFEKLQLIEQKASAYLDGNPGLENWRIALMVNLQTKWKRGIKEDSKLTSSNEKARAYLGMLVSKNIAEALIVAENAARGKFPCKESINYQMRFDFDNLSKLLRERFIEEVQYMWDMSTEEKTIKHHDYTNVMMRQLQKKRRAQKRFEKLVEQEIARREKGSSLPLD